MNLLDTLDDLIDVKLTARARDSLAALLDQNHMPDLVSLAILFRMRSFLKPRR
jgi:hypothetical protein